MKPAVSQSMNLRTAASTSSAAVEIAGMTDQGRHRKRNEDAIDWDKRLGLAMVADGMGGMQGGDVASTTALRSIKSDLRRALAESHRHNERAQSREVRGSLVVELVRRANQAVRQSAGRDPRLAGMGTTLVMCLVGPDYLTVAHVGDSRLYRLRDRKLECLTEDHTMVQELVERGDMDARQAHSRATATSSPAPWASMPTSRSMSRITISCPATCTCCAATA